MTGGVESADVAKRGKRRRETALRLAVAIASLMLIGILPALVDVVEHWRTPESTGIARWAGVAMLLAVVQLAYIVYLVQIPDWSSLWVVAAALVLQAMLYAVLFGFTLLARTDSALLLSLGLTDALRSGMVRFWALLMTSLSAGIAVLCGVTAVRWRGPRIAS